MAAPGQVKSLPTASDRVITPDVPVDAFAHGHRPSSPETTERHRTERLFSKLPKINTKALRQMTCLQDLTRRNCIGSSRRSSALAPMVNSFAWPGGPLGGQPSTSVFATMDCKLRPMSHSKFSTPNRPFFGCMTQYPPEGDTFAEKETF